MSLFPDSWKLAEAREICSQIVDCVNKTAPVVDYETPYKMIRTTNVKNGRIDLSGARCVDEATFIKWNRRLTPRKGDVVLTREAPLGDIGLIRTDDKVFLGQRTMIFRADGINLDQRFLYYSLLGPTLQAQISALGSGSTVEHVRVPDAERLVIPHPPIGEQRKIAGLLSAYDDLIENNKRRITLLENMAEEIYREWFVRFRFPGWQEADFEKGLPAGWSIKRLNDILALQYGKALKSEDRVEGTVPVYGSSGVVGFHNEALVERPGIIVGRKGNVGAIHWSDVAFYPIDTVYYVVSDLSEHFLYYLLHSVNFINNDAAVPGLNRKQAYSNEVLVPKSGLIEQFEELVKPLYDQKRSLIKMNDNLEKTKNQLLPRLISGKLSLENLDIQFPPSMQGAQSDSADEAAA
ncbi:restriction endonuclease subunit S [Marinobacter flavimaris]|uniref:Restriction endonuclease subunit S n=1 Tax=Marinobacter flavimaris TaxID=262076 RepID=A0A3D8H427_9GAMM|nr:restriction endonuclease subunit S [Marinobacter flavimaris]MCP4062270.1 restriction endonuclease subunit S [Gammaproteobacteria bacterium]RDU41462.1 restriction endonuclease subunit S [Marinobacter flavimaris]